MHLTLSVRLASGSEHGVLRRALDHPAVPKACCCHRLTMPTGVSRSAALFARFPFSVNSGAAQADVTLLAHTGKAMRTVAVPWMRGRTSHQRS